MIARLYTGAVLLTAAGALVLEIVAARLIAPYVGMSLYSWTAIIAVVLAGLSVGHWIGGRLSGPDVDRRAGAWRTALALAAAAVTTLASLPLLRAVAPLLLSGDFATVPAVVLLTGVLFFLPSLFVGIVSPIITKLAIDHEPGKAGAVLGRMFAAGAGGSILGTLLAGYLFISWIGATGTVIAVAALYALLAAGFAVWARRAAVIALVLAVPAAGLIPWGRASLAYQSPCQVESDYFCIRIDDFAHVSGRPSRLMVLDHLVHSINDRDDPALFYSPYAHFVDEAIGRRLADSKDPKAFIIGGGGYTLPRAWLNQPGMTVTVAELDPVVTRVAAEGMWLDAAAPGLRVIHKDARVVLATLPKDEKFDLIFGDAFHDIAVPAHLVTQEFHAEVARRLRPGGVYGINVVDLGSSPLFLLALVRTLKIDFPVVEVWKTVGEMDDNGRVTFVVWASDTPSPGDRLRARRGVERSWLRWPQADLAARIEAADPPVLTDDFAPVDRLLAPLLIAAAP